MAIGCARLVLAAVCALAIACRPSLAIPGTAWAAIRAAENLTISEAVLQQFPYMAEALEDPGFTGTLFLPTDAAWLKLTEAKSVRQAIASIIGSFNPALVKQSLYSFGSASYYWQSISLHVVVGQALKLSDLKPGKVLTTALGSDNTITVGRPSSTGAVTLSGDQNSASVTGTLWQSANKKAVLYAVDTVLFPTVAPQDYLDPIQDFLGSFYPSFAAIVKGASSTAQASILATPLLQPTTLFVPSEDAVKSLLTKRKTTLAALTKDTKACTAIVQAHVLPGARLWLWDLMNNAALRGAGGASGAALLPTFLNGTPLQANITGLGSKVVLIGPKGVVAQAQPPVDLGGNPFGCTSPRDKHGQCQGDQGSVAHAVDSVLLAA